MPSPTTRTAISTAVLVMAAVTAAAPVVALERRTAVFAGGCYWTMQHDMERVTGVTAVRAGFVPFTAGDASVVHTRGAPQAYEAVLVSYDAGKISYRALVARYLHMIDPTDPGGAFCDRGPNYRSAVFTASAQERADVQAEIAAAAALLPRPIVTQLLGPADFHPAPPDQQDWARTHAPDYERYRQGCGKDRRIQALWGAQARR